MERNDDVICNYVDLPPIIAVTADSSSNSNSIKLLSQPLSESERQELEVIVEFDKPGRQRDSWHEDWSGNGTLAFLDKDIANPRLVVVNNGQNNDQNNSSADTSSSNNKNKKQRNTSTTPFR